MRSKGTSVLGLLLTLLLLGQSLAGCGGKQQPAAEQQATTGQEAPKSANGLPIVSKPLKLTVWAEQDGKTLDLVKNYSEIEAFKELQKRTGIEIEWQHPATGQAQEQFNLLLASNELPDMMYWNWRGIPGGPEKAIQDGYIVKLNDLIAKNAPTLSKLYAENPEVRKQVVTDSGTHYIVPFIRGALMKGGDPETNFFSGPQFRQDWLEKLGLKAPATLEEWYTALKAFKEKDPNGNGKADEIGFASVKDGGLRQLASAWGLLFDFYPVQGKIKYGPMEPAFKDYLTTMRKWYAEGLIDKDYATTDDKNFRAKVTDGVAGAYIGSLGGNFGNFTTLMKDKDPKFKLTAAPWPKGPAGKSYTAQGGVDHAVTGQGIAITTKNKHLVESVRWLDYNYTPEGVELMNFGVQGLNYTGTGNDLKYMDFITSKGIDLSMGKYAIGGISGWATIQDNRNNYLNRTVPGQTELPKIYGTASKELILPPTTPTREESGKIAAIMSEVNTYTGEMFNKFVMGVEPVDKFDSFVETLKKMKIEEAVKIQQDALDRYNSRK